MPEIILEVHFPNIYLCKRFPSYDAGIDRNSANFEQVVAFSFISCIFGWVYEVVFHVFF